MKFSKSFTFTSKEIPNDIDQTNIAQVLATRAGFIKRMSNGLYIHTPFMLRLMEKIKNEIKRQMAAVDCAEVKFPVLVTKPDLVESGRWDIFGREIFKLKDRSDKDLALSPTNEEASCFMARQYIKSHNQLPMALYQIQKKYRDEISPRGGLMRGREFLMKDAYSFHANEKCMEEYYAKMKVAYHKIFKNLGLENVYDVTSDNGTMGGRDSREYMVLSPHGMDTIAICACGNAYNTEVLETRCAEDISQANNPQTQRVEDVGGEKSSRASHEQACPACKKPMRIERANELGHIYALCRRYSDKLNLTFTDTDGKQKLFEMATFGIGLDRIAISIIEQHNDERGIAFPEHLAPITHNIITLNMDDTDLVAQSEKLYHEYLERGIAVMWDERNVGAGVKLKDSDLLGIPNKIVISKKGISHETR